MQCDDAHTTVFLLYYRQWDGRAWADLRPLSTEVTPYSAHWAVAVVDGNNVAHVAWRGKTDGILYADAPQVAREIGSMIDTVHNELGPVCLLTEYYETQNFRIYYTRTFPNTLNEHIEKDCSIQEPQRLNNAPNETNPDLNNPAFSGYPQYAVELGASLEKSSAQFSAMGYPVNRVPKDPSSDRYVVFITSSPIWTNNPFVGNIHSTGVTFPDEMYIPRTDQFNADNPIDFLRPQAAHEFFHAAQWTYVPSAPIGGQGGTWATTEDLRWWMEATATWSEPKVYSESGKYAADLDSLFSQPYLAMTGQPFANVNPRAYGSFIFASYLEQKVANTDTIIRQIWEKYQANNGSGGMIAAIDQVLQEQYATSLRNEFPKFTWNNYFLNDGTYTRAVNLYFDVFNPVGNPRAAPEWELFRSWLVDPRNNYQQEHAGVLTKPENSYPASGPQNYPSGVDALGSGYIEFLSPANVAAGTQLNVTLYTNLEPNLGDTAVQAYVIPILPTHFTTLPHPDGTLLAPQPSQKWIGTYLTQYTFHIENFDRCGRITLILNNVNTQTIAYRFEADLTQPPLPPNDPCLVRTP